VNKLEKTLKEMLHEIKISGTAFWYWEALGKISVKKRYNENRERVFDESDMTIIRRYNKKRKQV
jgi:hypothetical protein